MREKSASIQAGPMAQGSRSRRQRSAEAVGLFARESARYPLTGTGDVNTYALFAELFEELSRKRAGAIVPTGIATDDTTKSFFESLVSGRRLCSLWSFFEVRRWFPATDDRKPFCILCIGSRPEAPEFIFDAKTIGDVFDSNRRFSLSAADIERVNPNTKTAPLFRSRADAKIASKIYGTASVLVRDNPAFTSNDWGAYYLRLIHFGDHAKQLRTAEDALSLGFAREGLCWCGDQEKLLPVYESKLTNMYDPHYASFSSDGNISQICDKNGAEYIQNFRYWVSEHFFRSIMLKYGYEREWLLVYRDVVRSTDERTVIALAIPRSPASIKLPALGVNNDAPAHLLLANLNSLPLDYVARQKIGGSSLSFFILKQLPIIPLSGYTASDIAFVTPRVLELSYTSHSMAPFARDLKFEGPPFRWDEDRRALLRAELDAYFARLYGLTREELLFILDPAYANGPNYPSETFRVLRKNEEAKYGEYRTARLVMQAWDELAARGKVA
jgi:hypothetical protein